MTATRRFIHPTFGDVLIGATSHDSYYLQAATVDTTAPVLSSASVDEANNRLSTNSDEGGTYYYVVETSSPAMTGSHIKMMVETNDGYARGSFSVTTGVNNHSPDFSGLTVGQVYYLHQMVLDAGGNYSIDVPILFEWS